MSDLNSRYGTRQRPRWFWPAITAIGLGLGIAFAAWVGFQKDPVSAQLSSYTVVDDQKVTVFVEVTRPDPLAVRCSVYAQAQDHSIVGEKTFDLPATDPQTIKTSTTIETERRAVNGVLRTCKPID